MRTKKSLKNILSIVIFNLVIGVLGFLKVHFFVKELSNDIYSLNQLFYQVFSYIVITDIGFGLLINKAFYNAFAQEDYAEVNKIYSTSKKFYNIIGVIMLGISVFVSFFIQYLTKADVSIVYIQIVFIIFMIRNVVDYFFVAPRYVLEADQKLYKINHFLKLSKILEIIVEIALVILGVDYILILIPGIFITVFIDIYVNKKIKQYYPWLQNDKSFNKNYLKGTKDVIWRKLAGLLNSNTDIILISTFVNPLNVIIYTSYTYITKFITDTIYLMCHAILPSFANVMIKEDEAKAYSTFNEINTFFQFMAVFVFIMLYVFLNNLIVFWVGETYLVTKFCLFLFCFNAFQLIAEKSITLVINSKGLFKETKLATIVEALLNLSLSLGLIFKFGIIGVLLGTVVSYLLAPFVQNSRYIYKNVFKKSSWSYYIQYLFVCIIGGTMIYLLSLLNLTTNSVFTWVLEVLILSMVVIIILFILFFIFFKSFRLLVKRGVEFINVKGQYNE